MLKPGVCYDPQEVTLEEEPENRRTGESVKRILNKFPDSPIPPFPLSASYVPCGRCDSLCFKGKGIQGGGFVRSS